MNLYLRFLYIYILIFCRNLFRSTLIWSWHCPRCSFSILILLSRRNFENFCGYDSNCQLFQKGFEVKFHTYIRFDYFKIWLLKITSSLLLTSFQWSETFTDLLTINWVHVIYHWVCSLIVQSRPTYGMFAIICLIENQPPLLRAWASLNHTFGKTFYEVIQATAAMFQLSKKCVISRNYMINLWMALMYLQMILPLEIQSLKILFSKV